MKNTLHSLWSIFPLIGLLTPGSLFALSVETGILGQGRIGAVTATSQGEFLVATADSLIRLSAEGKILSRTAWQHAIGDGSAILDMAVSGQGEVIIVLGAGDGTLRTQMIGRAPALVAPSSGRKFEWKAKLIATSKGWLILALDKDKRDLWAWALDHSGAPVSAGKRVLEAEFQVEQLIAVPRPGGAMAFVYASPNKGQLVRRNKERQKLTSYFIGIFAVPLNEKGEAADDPLQLYDYMDYGDDLPLLAASGPEPSLVCRAVKSKEGKSWVCETLDDKGVPQSKPMAVASRDPKGVNWGRPAVVPYGNDWLVAFTVFGVREKSFKPLGSGRISQSESDVELAVLREGGKGPKHLKSLRKKHGDPLFSAVGKRHALFVWNQGGSYDSNNEFCIVKLRESKGH